MESEADKRPHTRQWEYKLFESKDADVAGLDRRGKRTRLQQYLTSLGREGWEIINIDFHDLNIGMSFVGVAKRPLTEES
jgi:hypothetical protein